jgi:hypothetical protein
MSEANNSEATTPDPWQLPRGMRVPEASRRMSDADKRLLHKQAYDQAGNFEVLNKRDVASLSRVRSPPILLDHQADCLAGTKSTRRTLRLPP